MGNDQRINWSRVLIPAGAVIVFTVGLGFTTGQEIIQYFTAYGVQGTLTIPLFTVCLIYYNYNFAKAGAEEHFERGNDVYKFYYRTYIGAFTGYYSTVFCYTSLFIIVGGATSTLDQQYGLPFVMGGVILTVLAILTAVGGLNPLVDRIGLVGPAIVTLCIGTGAVILAGDGGQIGAGLEIIHSGASAQVGSETMKNAGPNWMISSLPYAGFMLLWSVGFTIVLGASNQRKGVEYGAYLGTVAVCVAIILTMLVQIVNINTAGVGNNGVLVWNIDISNLTLAERIWKPFASIFVVVVSTGIYTTAMPLLYSPCVRFAKEGTPRFKILTAILGTTGLLVGLFLPFRVPVSVIYALNGYVGVILISFILWKNIKDTFIYKKRKSIS